MKNLSILGSTGSIGTSTLKIVEQFPGLFSVKALAAKNNISLMAKQIEQFKPELAVVYNGGMASDLKSLLPKALRIEIMHGEEGYREAAILDSVDMVLTAVVGSAGLLPTLAAIDAGKEIALANKETLVMAGEIVIKKAAEKGVRILPVDSEHSAIFQCLSGSRIGELDSILLTASGGPFLNRPKNDFVNISPDDALKHPTWDMGKKITIDSATLMNKGLEVIEARWLFNVSHSMIKVVIHPQSIVHSMVAFQDGAVIAQMGVPDMKGAIAYALSYPRRLPLKQPAPDFAEIGALTFQAPDFEKFPCLALAFQAIEVGKTLPAVLNAANEIAVKGFLDQKVTFQQIPVIIRETMDTHHVVNDPDLEDIIDADRWARGTAEKRVGRV